MQRALVSYVLVFVAIWLAWVNFTWFASAYDTDDVGYRLGVLVVMTGALVLAAGVPRIFDQRDFSLAVVGYVIMRIALVTQWIRVAIDDPPRRKTARRFAVGGHRVSGRLADPARGAPALAARLEHADPARAARSPPGPSAPGGRRSTPSTSPSATACS